MNSFFALRRAKKEGHSVRQYPWLDAGHLTCQAIQNWGTAMKRATIGALCVGVCLLSLLEARRARQALKMMALEKVEHVFDAVEHVFHPV
jgi:hypothetical protein